MRMKEHCCEMPENSLLKTRGQTDTLTSDTRDLTACLRSTGDTERRGHRCRSFALSQGFLLVFVCKAEYSCVAGRVQHLPYRGSTLRTAPGTLYPGAPAGRCVFQSLSMENEFKGQKLFFLSQQLPMILKTKKFESKVKSELGLASFSAPALSPQVYNEFLSFF